MPAYKTVLSISEWLSRIQVARRNLTAMQQFLLQARRMEREHERMMCEAPWDDLYNELFLGMPFTSGGGTATDSGPIGQLIDQIRAFNYDSVPSECSNRFPYRWGTGIPYDWTEADFDYVHATTYVYLTYTGLTTVFSEVYGFVAVGDKVQITLRKGSVEHVYEDCLVESTPTDDTLKFLVLTPFNMIANGDFVSALSEWDNGTHDHWATGGAAPVKCTHTAGVGDEFKEPLTQYFDDFAQEMEEGGDFRLVVSMSNRTAGSCDVSFDGGVTTQTLTNNITQSWSISGPDSLVDNGISFIPTADFDGKLYDIALYWNVTTTDYCMVQLTASYEA